MRSAKDFAAALEISETKAARLDSILRAYGCGKLSSDDVLNRANALIGGFGVETIEQCGSELEYVNRGDTYALTLLYEDGADEPFTFGCWGGWIEEIEAAEAEIGNVRCGWCSEFTPVQNDDWRSTTCGSCGHCVSG